MFSMFFGAGNVVFPLITGQLAQNHYISAILGLLLTAVGVPFLGLMAMTLFNGDSHAFFSRIGKIPGFLLAAGILALIGPLGGMPRVITVSYSTTNMFFPGLSLPIFSALFCLAIFFFTYRRSRIIELLGKVLTPLLLGSLLILIIKGLISAQPMGQSAFTEQQMFWNALKEGYNTMDLMGAFFFSSVVILCLKQGFTPDETPDLKHLVRMTFRASCIGALLLGLSYIGFLTTAAYHSSTLASVSPEALLGTLALNILGPFAGIIAIAAVALACLTTAIALAAVFAEFLHEEIFKYKLGFVPSLALTLIASFFISLLKFQGIMGILATILLYFYPALIVLSAVNLAYKLWNFTPVKIPFWTTLALTAAYYSY